ncbi:MAG: hypothetical protein J6K58_04780 [Lachnospiraceae bacterium]|nr:hypothetical protein [Lachnospiraceae bacterium]
MFEIVICFMLNVLCFSFVVLFQVLLVYFIVLAWDDYPIVGIVLSFLEIVFLNVLINDYVSAVGPLDNFFDLF